MRIAYDNILDDLTSTAISALSEESGYEITNALDQRLSTLWKTSSATTQTATFTLDTFPTYPDNVSGQSYFQHFDTATVDGCIATLTASNMTIYATTSSLVLKATTATEFDYLGFSRGLAWTTGQTLIMKTPYDVDISSIQYWNGTSYTSMTLVNDNDINYFAEASMIRGNAYLLLTTSFNYTSTAIAATKTVNIDYVYLGDGKYDFPLTDLSGNGNDGTCYNVVPGQKGLLFGGIKSYCTIVNISSFFGVGKISVISCKVTPLSATAGFIVSYADTANNNRFYLYLLNATTLLFYANDNTTTIAIPCATNEEARVLLVRDNSGAGVMAAYKNGVLVESKACTPPDTASSSVAFVLGANATGGDNAEPCLISDVALYNRIPSDFEISHLYAGESFITENDGLVGKWNINDGLGVNTSAILNHNIKTGSVAKIQASDNNYWTDPPVDETFTINPTTILKFLSDTYYYKYWRFYIEQGSLEIGRLWLGDYLTIDPSSLTDFKVTKRRSDMVIHGKNRQKWANIGTDWRKFEFSFPRTEETMIYNLTKMYDTVGNHSSFIFCNLDTLRDYTLIEPVYCSIADEELSFMHTNRTDWTYSLTLEEEK